MIDQQNRLRGLTVRHLFLPASSPGAPDQAVARFEGGDQAPRKSFASHCWCGAVG